MFCAHILTTANTNTRTHTNTCAVQAYNIIANRLICLVHCYILLNNGQSTQSRSYSEMSAVFKNRIFISFSACLQIPYRYCLMLSWLPPPVSLTTELVSDVSILLPQCLSHKLQKPPLWETDKSSNPTAIRY